MSEQQTAPDNAGLEIASVTGDETQPRKVTPGDPLVIASTNPKFEWIQIEPGGEIQVQVESSITIKKLEKLN